MKKVFTAILLFTLLLLSSACSLLDDNDVIGTQSPDNMPDGVYASENTGADRQNPDASAAGDARTDSLEGGNAKTGASTGDDSANDASTGDALPDEAYTGSASSTAKMIKVTLYFASEDNSVLKREKREVEVIDGAILRACILALIEGPVSRELRQTIPKDTEIRGISIKDNTAIVDLSNEFLEAKGIEEIAARLSLVNTLTEINGIEKVRLRIEGEDMKDSNGIPLGDMRSSLDDL